MAIRYGIKWTDPYKKLLNACLPGPLANIKTGKMENWSFNINKRPNEITEKLESELNAIGGFVFDKKNTTTFSFRKRVLYAWYLAFQNWTIVNAKLAANNTENTTNVNISFNQHFLMRLIVFIHIILGLGLIFGLFLTSKGEPSAYILGGLVLALGIILWITTKRKFKKDAEKYKGLITKTFGL